MLGIRTSKVCRINLTGVLVAAAALTGCGGSGSDDSSGGGSPQPGAPTVRAVVTGLTGNGLHLQLNGSADIEINSDGQYVFTAALARGDLYNVSVAAAPDNPVQQCIVDDPIGTIDGNVDVAVQCANARPGSLLVASQTGTARPVTGLITTYDAGEPSDLLSPVATHSQPYFVQLSRPIDIAHRQYFYSLVSITSGVDPYPRAVTGIQLDPEAHAMSDVPAAPVLLSGTGNALTPRSMDLVVEHPSRRFLYAAGHNFPGLSVFSIDQASGALTSASGNPMLADPNDFLVNFAIHPNGKLALAGFWRDFDEPGEIRSYRIDPESGALTLIATLLTPEPLAWRLYLFPIIPVPQQTIMTADGRFAHFSLGYPDNQVLLTVAMDAATGTLSIPAGGELSPPEQMSLVAKHPFAPFRYYTSQTRLLVYRVESNGTLSLVGDAPQPASTAQFGPTGKYLYVANEGNVHGYAVDPQSGLLTPVPETGAETAIYGDAQSFEVDPSGKQLYVLTRHDSSDGIGKQLYIFNIDRQTGQLANSPYSPMMVDLRSYDLLPLARPVD